MQRSEATRANRHAAVPDDFKKFVRSLSEQEFRGLVLLPLLEAMGYRHITVTHGPRELGKDVVFEYATPLDGTFYSALVIKAGRITGNVASASSARALLAQAQQCFDTPYLRADGTTVLISRVYICSNSELTTEAKESVRGALLERYRQIEFVGLDELLTFIREYLPSLFEASTTAVSIYIKDLFDSNFFVKNLQLLGSARQIPLHRCYIPATLELFEDRLVSDTLGAAASELGRVHPYLLICGGPGSGKSTLIQKQILTLIADNDIRPKRNLQCLPIFVPLRHLPDTAVHNKKQFIAAVEQFAPSLLPHLTDAKRVQGVHLFLDGLDEMYDSSARLAFTALAPEIPSLQIFKLPVTACMLTTRTYAASNIRNFKTAYVRPFGPTEIRAFAARWFEQDPSQARRFSEFLLSRADLKYLAASPLLLTLIASVTENQTGEIQGSRTTLYEQALQMLAGRWDQQRGLELGPSGDETTRFLMFLATEMFESGVLTADSVLLDRVSAHLADEGVALPAPTPDSPTHDRYRRAGLLVTNTFGNIEFGHRSIAEFCCARHLYTLRLEARLKRSILREEWRNVISFYFGLLRRLDFADPALVKSLETNPFLKLECVIEADRTPTRIREALVGSIVADLASGRLSFTNEALSLVRLGNEQILRYADDLLKRQGAIQVSFYLAVIDLIAHYNDRRSRLLLRAFDAFVHDKDLTREQVATLVFSYLSGPNSVCADLVENHFNGLDAISTGDHIVQNFRGVPGDGRRRRLFERLHSDVTLAVELEQRASEAPEQEQRSFIDMDVIRRVSRERSGPLGSFAAARALAREADRAREWRDEMDGNDDLSWVAMTDDVIGERKRLAALNVDREMHDMARKFLEHLKRDVDGPLTVRALDLVSGAISTRINAISRRVTRRETSSHSITLEREMKSRLTDLKKHIGELRKVKVRAMTTQSRRRRSHA